VTPSPGQPRSRPEFAGYGLEMATPRRTHAAKPASAAKTAKTARPAKTAKTAEPAGNDGTPLGAYRAKRDPARTPEPMGSGRPRKRKRQGRPSFVIQEHHARALHWDFRLEYDGVLVSWALPKGIPEDPKTNHLAVHTEDHPLEYGSFAGDIQPGEYGGGHVSIWDRGDYELEKWSDTEVKVVLHGSRAQGRYVLFSTDRKAGRKAGDGTGRKAGDLAGGKNWMIHRMDPPREGFQPLPDSIRPMLAAAGSLPADDDGWAYEVSWDGVRAIVSIDGGRVRAVDADDRDITASFPELRAAGEKVGPRPAVLDGEIIALGADGRPSASRLQRRLNVSARAEVTRRAREVPVTYVVFDVLHLDGESLLGLPYRERRRQLEALGMSGKSLLTGDSYRDVRGADVLAAARENGLGGIVAKRLDAPYRPGRRSRDWQKITRMRSRAAAAGGGRAKNGGGSR
jgi:bifunctional non-homologous end joining protein LigD